MSNLRTADEQILRKHDNILINLWGQTIIPAR